MAEIVRMKFKRIALTDLFDICGLLLTHINLNPTIDKWLHQSDG